jgi:hypothetical protein
MVNNFQIRTLPSRLRACRSGVLRYIKGMNYLTKQEQLVLCIVVGLLLTGWMVKWYRTAHPAAVAAVVVAQPVKP